MLRPKKEEGVLQLHEHLDTLHHTENIPEQTHEAACYLY